MPSLKELLSPCELMTVTYKCGHQRIKAEQLSALKTREQWLAWCETRYCPACTAKQMREDE